MDEDVEPILIVGAGPVGATLALELARQGHRSVLIDRHTGVSRHPKMDFLNPRSMEFFRRLHLAEEIRTRGVGEDFGFNFLWIRSFLQPPVAEWRNHSVAEERQRIREVNDGSSPAEAHQRLPGNVLEEILQERARQEPLVDFRPGTSFDDVLENDTDGVLVRFTGPGGEGARLRARYLIGCDGAKSQVRQSIDVPVVEVGPSGRFRDLYFRSSDPVLRKQGRFFLAVSTGGITLVSRDEADTWTGFFPLFDEREAEADPVELMRARLGVDVAVDEVLNAALWRGAMAVADRYRSGSVFLAGDAAHQFYPTGGHGANTGLGDAVDLAWKLVATLDGWGGPELLDSYQAERQPVARFNREMCGNLLEVWQRYPRLAAEGASDEQLAGFLQRDSYQIENTGIHLDYRYVDSAIVCPESDRPSWTWNRATPSTVPGCRVPSVLLADGSALYDQFGVGFTLVDLTPDGVGERALKSAEECGVPLHHLHLDDPNVRAAWGSRLVLVRPDQHAAWRSDHEPERWHDVLTRVTGREDR